MPGQNAVLTEQDLPNDFRLSREAEGLHFVRDESLPGIVYAADVTKWLHGTTDQGSMQCAISKEEWRVASKQNVVCGLAIVVVAGLSTGVFLGSTEVKIVSMLAQVATTVGTIRMLAPKK